MLFSRTVHNNQKVPSQLAKTILFIILQYGISDMRKHHLIKKVIPFFNIMQYCKNLTKSFDKNYTLFKLSQNANLSINTFLPFLLGYRQYQTKVLQRNYNNLHFRTDLKKKCNICFCKDNIVQQTSLKFVKIYYRFKAQLI